MKSHNVVLKIPSSVCPNCQPMMESEKCGAVKYKIELARNKTTVANPIPPQNEEYQSALSTGQTDAQR